MSQRCIFRRRLKEVLLIRCQGKLHLTFQLSRWVKVRDGRLEYIAVKHVAGDRGGRKEKRYVTQSVGLWERLFRSDLCFIGLGRQGGFRLGLT